MSYQVIARKWRSQSFNQLVGQDHVTITLQNALKNNRLAHALLFTGPRGTGKTSSARILAKALRCANSVNFVPCNECNDCLEISMSRSPNVIEIDGASNNGVDAIRDLRDSVMFAPSSGKYKIYIIDEVHMLTTSAFNALLKTLEEPPNHVIFVMATTEVHKIPQTILSRCQRFDFRRISTKAIADHLRLICDTDGISAEDEALWMIARQGDGSMRDSQSLLDQAITFSNGPLTTMNVAGVLGLTDHSLLLELVYKLVHRDSVGILPSLQKISMGGHDPGLFATDLLENIRHLLLTKVGEKTETNLVELPDSEIRFFQGLARQVSEEDIHLLFDMMLKSAADIHRAADPRVVLEMSLLRMAVAPRVASLEALLARGVGDSLREEDELESYSQPASESQPKLNPLAKNSQDKWFEFVQTVKNEDSPLAAIIEHLLFVSEKDKVLELIVPAHMSLLKAAMADGATLSSLQSFIDKHWGTGYSFRLMVAPPEAGFTSAKAIEKEIENKKKQKMAEQVANHPKVRAVNSAFNGQIKTIEDTTKEMK